MGRGRSKAGGAKALISTEETLKNQSEKWFQSLDSKEKLAIINAQYSTQNLNEFLSGRRNDFNDEMRESLTKEAALIDSALSKFKTNNEIVTYRGVSAEEFTNTYLGIETSTKGVKSTSYDSKTAENFAKNQGGFIIEYHVKPGNHGADVNGVAGANEKEFLIRNNMKQTVVKKDGKNKLVVEIG